MSKLKVIVNLSRLVSGGDGAGGAGWFSLFFARAAARCVEATVFVNARNRAMILNALAGETFRHLVVDDLSAPLVRSAIAECHVYVDPLNGLEPDDIPASVHAIAVIHDLMFLDCPYFFTEAELAARALNYGASIARADTVLTVSAAQQAKIRTLYNKAHVEWIAQPPYFNIQGPSAIEKAPTGRFIMFPGIQWNHKNHFRLFAAFMGLCERGLIDDDIHLVVTKARAVEDATTLHMESRSRSPLGRRIREQPYLSQSDYAGFMRCAHGIVLPTLYEGYGIPVIEAVANGIPILTSLTPSLKSIRNPPPFLSFIPDPRDIGSIARALREFISAERAAVPTPESVPSVAEFDARVASILVAAGDRPNRGEGRLPVVVKSLPLNPRRTNSLTLHVFAASLDVPALTRLDALLRGPEGKTAIKAIVYAPFSASVAARADAPAYHAIRITCADPVSASGDIVLAHELVMSESRYNLLLRLRDAVKVVPADLDLAVGLLAQSPDINTLDILRGADSLTAWGETAELLRGRLIDIERLGLDFDVDHDELAASLRGRMRSRAITGKDTFLICDPSLSNKMGHHANVARSLAIGANALGFRAVVAGNRAAAASLLAPDARVDPIFDDYLYGGKNDIAAFAAQLEGVAGKELIHSRSAISLFCATPAMLGGAIAFLLARDAKMRPTIYIRFDRDESRAPRARVTYADCFRLISGFGLHKHFRFFTESIGLRRHFQQLSGLEFDLLFNSIDDVAKRLEEIGVVRRSPPHDEIVIAYLGEARAEKGFQFLPVIVDYVLSQYRTDRKLTFRIQVTANQHNETDEIKTARASLAMLARQDPRVELLGYLDDAAYVDAIHSSHALLLPYLPTEYVVRGSGIATEAAAVGKPFIVSRGTDICLTFQEGGVVVPDRQDEIGLGKAVCKLVDEYPAWSERALQYLARNKDLFGDEVNFVRRQVGAKPASVDEAKYVLWLSNDTRGEGSGIVYDSQLDFLAGRGYQVVKLVIPYPTREDARERREFDFMEFLSTLEWRPSFDDTPGYRGVVDKIYALGNSHDNFTAAWGHLYFPEALRKLLLTLKFDFVVVNYAHHAAVLETLGIGRQSPWIVETHDLQCYQYALQQGREVDPTEIRQELEALSAFDHLVSISATEAKTFESRVASKVTWCLPSVDFAPPMERLSQSFDLLVVGSDHDANVISIRWFIQSVYQPILYKEGLTLAVVGSVCGKLDRSALADRITYFGRVPDLGPYYEAARIVVLPVIAGAGVPIKVLDAFARGKPFSLTRFPAAAMGLPSDFPLTDNAFGMAQDVLALFDSEELSHARAERGRLFYEASASAQVYDFKWEHLLRSTGVDVASSPAPIGRSKEDRRVSRTSTHVAGDAVAAKPARGEANKELGAVLTLERVYAFETDPSLSIGLGAGWYPAEHTGVWCGANGGAFTAVLRSGDPALEIESVSWVEATIKCRVFGSLARGPNEVNVSNDQKIVATWRFENDSLREMKVVLPITAGEAFPIARFVMRPLHAWSPAELGIGEDRRKLGLLLVGMTFRATDPPPADATAIGSVEG